MIDSESVGLKKKRAFIINAIMRFGALYGTY